MLHRHIGQTHCDDSASSHRQFNECCGWTDSMPGIEEQTSLHKHPGSQASSGTTAPPTSSTNWTGVISRWRQMAKMSLTACAVYWQVHVLLRFLGWSKTSVEGTRTTRCLLNVCWTWSFRKRLLMVSRGLSLLGHTGMHVMRNGAPVHRWNPSSSYETVHHCSSSWLRSSLTVLKSSLSTWEERPEQMDWPALSPVNRTCVSLTSASNFAASRSTNEPWSARNWP